MCRGTGVVGLLFAKSKVYVHPSNTPRDYVPGFVALVRPAPNSSDRDILLAWLPEAVLGPAEAKAYAKVDLSPDDGLSAFAPGSSPQRGSVPVYVPLPAASSLATFAFAVPLHRVYSVMLYPPSFGSNGKIAIHTRDEATIPPLFFHDAESQSTIMQQRMRNKQFTPFAANGDLFWGGDQFMKYLRRYAVVERSAYEQRLYLINPDPDDLLRFQPAALDIPHPVANASAHSGDPLQMMLKSAGWNVLERLARVTRLSRRAADDVSPAVRAILNAPEVRQLGDDFDSARVYLAKWAMTISEEAERNRPKVVWTDVVGDHISSMVGDVGGPGGEGGGLNGGLDPHLHVERRNEVSLDEWRAFFDNSGMLKVTVSEVKERIFHGGLAPNVRPEAWLFLLGVYPWDSSGVDRRAIIASKRDEYFRLKGQWWDDIDRQQNDAVWKDQRNRIEKDVHRTDRNIPLFAGEDIPHPDPDSPFANIGTNVHLEQLKYMLITYNEYNKTLGYVQGMSDLLSPIYAVIQDDAVAFWAFVGYMNRMERNFLRDQAGMHRQLLALDNLVQLMEPELYSHLERADSTNFFFVFRMLLVWFKREFKWDDVLRLWEVLWTDYLSSQFVLFVALAILDKHKDVIMTHLEHFDEVLKYMNELAKTIDLEETLTRAEELFYRFQRTVDAIDRRNKEPNLAPISPIGSRMNSSTAVAGNGRTSIVRASSSGAPPRTGNGATRVTTPSLPQKTLSLKSEAGRVVISDVLRELLSRKIFVVKDTIPMDQYEA
ncbi:rab-GTPase-TBC domain-containing protein [Limtongia smithiae]|uniref:rab-GTPase-TBC domain-containing protein n=1 Tax=Limtongia smithiae TaxID=1125753 RepID=UPI0034CEDB84